MDSSMEDVIARLRDVQNSYGAKRDALKAELDKLDVEYRRAERALKVLMGERLIARPRPGPSGTARAKPSKLSVERLDSIREAVLEFALDHEEFRQVDIRTMAGVDPAIAKSSTMALGFEALRQDGVIRLARAEGNNKWFRLTRQAMSNGA